MIIDYGVGNLFSLVSSLKYLGMESRTTSDAGDIESAEKIILPGVGAFGDAMAKLCATGLVPHIKRAAASGIPFLGICVGMQMLFDMSFEYGRHEGLGLLPGEIYPMEDDLRELGLSLKIPQIGWNSLEIVKSGCPVLRNTKNGEFFYYVHSYYAKNCEASLAACSEYGVRVPGVVWSGNVFGSQFHPEKSGEAGLRFLRAFGEL